VTKAARIQAKGEMQMAVTISAARKIHLLDGDSTGGGHRHGSGNGKSEFPADWSDDKIIRATLSIANNPDLIGHRRGSRRIIDALFDSVKIRVVIENDLDVITAYPLN